MPRCQRSGLALAIAFAVFAPAFAEDKYETGHLAQLARQLGSSDYTEREAAERQLDAAGVPALPVLRTAVLSDDLEIRRRADALLQQIEKRAESAKLLEPRTVRLKYRDVPLRDALADFNAKSGLFIQVGGDAAQANPNPIQMNRKINLDTEEVSIWAGLDQFCRAAGLVEQHLVTRNVASARDVARADMERNLRVARRQPAVEAAVGAVPSHRTIMVDGLSPRLPTSITGPIRIRALTPQIPLGSFSKTDKDVQLSIEVSGDSKLTWLQFGNLRIEKAIDDCGQSLLPLLTLPAAPSPQSLDELIWVDANSRPSALAIPPYRLLLTRLELGQKPSKALRELSGTLSAQVQTPQEPLLTLDNLGRSIGQVVRGADGCSMELRDVKHDENGEMTLRVCVRVPLPPQNLNPLQRGGRVRVVRNRVVATSPGHGPTNPAILDAHGKVIPAQAQIRSEDAVAASVQEITLTCRVSRLRAETAKLVYSGPRTIVIEVPFELMDVPLK